jgi:hypothetical protein
MATNKLGINDPLTDNMPGAPPPEDTPNKEHIDSQQPDITPTPDPIQTKAHRQVVGVQNEGGGKHMAKQLDCTTSIASTQNNGIHGIHCSLHMTFSRLRHLAWKRKHG